MNHSESVAAIAPAIVAAQAELKAAPKDTANPFYKSKYADLGGCMDTLRPVLGAHKLAVLQPPAVDNGIVSVETMLLHESGEWISCTLSCQPKDTGPQSIGSAITYLRRYGLALTGLVTEADDDGNAAQPGSKSHPAAAAPKAAPVDPDKVAARDAMLADMHGVPPSTPTTPPAWVLSDAHKAEITTACKANGIDNATLKKWRVAQCGEKWSQQVYDEIIRTLSVDPAAIIEGRQSLPF